MNYIEQALVCNALLVPFHGYLETIVTTDARGKGLGTVLSQVQNDGLERVVAFASKSLSEC